MDFALSEEQEEFRATLARFFHERAPVEEARRLMETADGLDRALWKEMAEELGLMGIHLPESCGGQGFGFLELGIAAGEMGRLLFSGPWFSTVCLAANAILEACDEGQARALLQGIAAGDTLATLALLEPSGPGSAGTSGWDPADIALRAEPDGDALRLTGTKSFVTDGGSADLVVVAARLPGTQGDQGLTLAAVRSDAGGLRVTPVDPLDATRKLARLDFDHVAAEPLGAPGESASALRRTLDLASVALACESAAGAEQCLESAVAYAKERVQFARPIGSFQAIKHKCAEVLLEVESARAASRWACWIAQERPDELPEASSVAKSVCGDAYLRASEENLQIHGGLGFTWEADPHLYLKRARANDVLLGDATYQRARLMRSKGV